MGLLELCEKYYGTTNLYEVLQISEQATDKEGCLILNTLLALLEYNI